MSNGMISFDGAVYRAAYQQSPRHCAIREGRHLTLGAAIDAIRVRHQRQGAPALLLTITAGSFPRGTMNQGAVLWQGTK